jgi:hypothetical protein
LPHLVTQPNGRSEVAALARERIADLKTALWLWRGPMVLRNTVRMPLMMLGTSRSD